MIKLTINWTKKMTDTFSKKIQRTQRWLSQLVRKCFAKTRVIVDASSNPPLVYAKLVRFRVKVTTSNYMHCD